MVHIQNLTNIKCHFEMGKRAPICLLEAAYEVTRGGKGLKTPKISQNISTAENESLEPECSVLCVFIIR